MLRMRRLGVLLTCWLLSAGCGDAAAPAQAADSGSAGNTPNETAGSKADPGASAGKTAGTAGHAAGSDNSGSGGHASTAGTGASAGKSGASGSAAGSGGSTSADAGTGACNPPCSNGQHCELVQVTCIRAPCPAQRMCVDDTAAGSCDITKVLCRQAVPQCPDGQVPSVSGTCFGPCVPIESCKCSAPTDCPDNDKYTCHKSAGHCGPYV